MIFQIPQKSKALLFPRLHPDGYPRHLAYVEWFSRAGAATGAGPNHGLYRIARSVLNGSRLGSIIAVDDIERSCHLFPEFGAVAARDWTTDNVLEKCPTFLLNTFVDRNTYMLVQ